MSMHPPRHRPRPAALARAVRAALLGGVILAAPLPLWAAPAASAQAYQITAGPLADVLRQFARQTGITISFTSEQVRGLSSQGVQGTHTGAQALAMLLAGSGLEAVAQGDNGYTLRVIPKSADGLQVLEQVTVTDQAEREAGDLPFVSAGSSAHITQEKIERFRGTSVGDIFQGTTGVLVAENRNSGGLDVNIRGMQGQGRVPVLIDGSRQETTVYRGYAGVVSRTYVDPDLIGGIDISKGPVMTADGTGATGGVVAMRTIGADDIIKPGKTSGVRIRGSMNGNSSDAPPPGTVAGMNGTGKTYRINCAAASLCQGEYAMPATFGLDEGLNRPGLLDFNSWAGSIAAAKRFEHFDIVAAYAQRSQGTYYTGKHGPVPAVELTYRELPFYTEVTALRDGISRFRAEERAVNSNNESNTLLLKGNIYLPEDQSWELSYLRYDSEYGELMPSQLIWLDEIKQTDNSTVLAQTWSSRYQWNPANLDWLNLRVNVWHTNTHTVNRNYSEDLIGMFSSKPTPERYDRWGGDVSNQMLFKRWGEHRLEYGLSAQREEMDTRVPLDDTGTPLGNAAYGRIGDRNELSLYMNWQYKPWPVLTLDAGLRYTRAETDDHKLVTPAGRNVCVQMSDDGRQCLETVYVESVFCNDGDGDGACDPIRYRTSNSGTAPVVSLTWEPWQNGLQFYARYAEALRMPSLFESTQGWSVQPALDVALKPEHATNREIGINLLRRNALFSGDRLATKLAGFQNITRDYLTRTSPNTWEEGGQIFVMRNIESVELHGVELSVEYDAGRVYGEIGGTYYNHIEVCHYGSYRRERCNDYGVANSYFNNMIPPKWHANATLGARFFDRRLDVGARGTFMGQRTETPPFNDDTAKGFNQVVPWHAYDLIDVYARWKHNDTVSVDFNIDNLTDQYYLDALSLGLVPAPGRTARVGVTLTF